jgi:hypothetical protein
MTVEWVEGGDVFLEGEATIVAEGEYFFAPDVARQP